MDVIKLRCPDCGRIELEPFDVGDRCLCGGIFEADRVVEEKKPSNTLITCPFCGARDCVPPVALYNVERYGGNTFVVTCLNCHKKVRVQLRREVRIISIEKAALNEELDFYCN